MSPVLVTRIPVGWPERLWDPLDYTPRLRRLALGTFVVGQAETFVYERYDPDVERIDRQKVFMVISLGGVAGRLIDVPGTDMVQHEINEFDHGRFRAILQRQSLREWWLGQGHPDEVCYAFTDPDGKLLSVRKTLFEATAEPFDIGV